MFVNRDKIKNFWQVKYSILQYVIQCWENEEKEKRKVKREKRKEKREKRKEKREKKRNKKREKKEKREKGKKLWCFQKLG